MSDDMSEESRIILALTETLKDEQKKVRELECERGAIISALLESGVETVKAPLASAVRIALKAAAADAEGALELVRGVVAKHSSSLDRRYVDGAALLADLERALATPGGKP